MSTSGVSSILGSINDAFRGKTSGIDVNSTVAALMQLQRAPETQMQTQQDTITTQIGLLTSMNSNLTTLYTAVNDLKDVFGALGQKDVTSSNSGVVTASADTTAASGSHTVVVKQLAAVSSAYSDPVTASQLASTEIDVAYGDLQNPTHTDKIAIPSSATTLQQVADAINTSADNTGVTASVQTDQSGQRLVFVSKNSGAAGNLTVTGAVKFSQGTTGQDASVLIDGVPSTSTTNTISGAVPGLTLTLSSASPATAVQVTVAPDTTGAATALNNFITAYNQVIQDINTQFTADNSGNEGPLAGDGALRSLQSQLLNAVTYSVSGTGQYVNLNSLGVEMQNDGTLQMNTSALNDVLSNHYADFQNFFQLISPQGFGQYLGTVMLQLTDPTDGVISLDISGLNATKSSIGDEIDAFEARMATVQQQLQQQYSALNVLLQQYPSQIQQIDSQLASLPTNSSKG